MRTLIFIGLVVISTINISSAQTSWEAGVLVGGASYVGDLNQRNFSHISGVHTEIHIKKNFDGYFGASFQYNFGIISENDANSHYPDNKLRNLSFETNLNEFNFMMEFNFFEFMQGVGRHKLTPFVYGGIGYVFFQPTTIYNGKRYDLSQFRTEGQDISYSKTAITIPYGLGIRFSLKENLQLLGKMGFREAQTDYLDDVSGYYPSKTNFDSLRAALSDRSGEVNGNYIGYSGSQRGDLRKRDKYMFVGIGISYTFVNSKCY